MKNVFVVEMNMGQVLAQVKQALPRRDRVFLVNRMDGGSEVYWKSERLARNEAE